MDIFAYIRTSRTTLETINAHSMTKLRVAFSLMGSRGACIQPTPYPRRDKLNSRAPVFIQAYQDRSSPQGSLGFVEEQ